MANRKRREITTSSIDYKKVLVAITVAVLIILMINYMSPSSSNESDMAEQDYTAQEAVSKATSSKPDTIVQKVKVAKNIRLPQVEILNGCGVSNITGSFTSFFKANKIDVIDTGNYSNFQQKTSFIIYHSKSVEKIARDLAENLSVSDVRADIKKIPTHELTLVLGADYGQLSQRVH